MNESLNQFKYFYTFNNVERPVKTHLTFAGVLNASVEANVDDVEVDN